MPPFNILNLIIIIIHFQKVHNSSRWHQAKFCWWSMAIRSTRRPGYPEPVTGGDVQLTIRNATPSLSLVTMNLASSGRDSTTTDINDLYINLPQVENIPEFRLLLCDCCDYLYAIICFMWGITVICWIINSKAIIKYKSSPLLSHCWARASSE